ncbi:unnamed protein product, partial [Rotaria sp. Silwood1]
IPNLSAVKLHFIYGKRWIDVDTMDEDRGDTALHITSRITSSNNNQVLTIIEMLLNAGAHIDFINYYGRTPLYEAVITDIRILLQSKQTPPQLKYVCAPLIRDCQMFNNYFWSEHVSLSNFVQFHGIPMLNNFISEKINNTSYLSDDHQSSDDFDWFE